MPQSCGRTKQSESQADCMGSRQEATFERPSSQMPKPACGCAGKSLAGQSAEQAAAAAASAEGQEASLVRAPVKHVLSQELQLYFDRVALLLRARPGLCTTPLARLTPAIPRPQTFRPPCPFLPLSLPVPPPPPPTLPPFIFFCSPCLASSLPPFLPYWHLCR